VEGWSGVSPAIARRKRRLNDAEYEPLMFRSSTLAC
jgi:hypothetical protein